MNLGGLVVVEAGKGIAPAYAGKLLLDLGATVLKVERPDRQEGRGALDEFLDAGKVAGSVADLAGADIVVAGPEADALLGGAGWRSAVGGGAAVVTVSPFGDDGPLAGRPATEFTLQAWCGLMSGCGTKETPPLQMGVGPGAWATGATAALAALATRRVGGGVVDVAALEVMAVCLNNYPTLYRRFTGQAAYMSRGGDWLSVVRCKDGWIGLCVFTTQQWDDFAAMIGRPDLAGDPRLNSTAGRSRHRELAESVIRPWLAEHTAAEIHELGGLFRVPVAFVGNGESVFGMDHLEARGVFVDHPAGFRQPRSPFRVTVAQGDGRPAGREGRRAPASRRGMARRPLAGVTVVDLTAFWAGPYATHLLATLGADVIKIESPTRPDGMRFATVKQPSEPHWLEYGPTFHGANPAKRSVAIDFSTPSGRDLVLRLVEQADVLVENFTPRVLANVGLDEPALRARRSDLVLLRMPGFGLDGPWRDHPGFAQTMEQVSGIAWLTGTQEGEPVARSTIDPITGIHGALAVLAALEHRDRTGHGQQIELPMVEVALNVASEPIVTWSADGVLLSREGNRGPHGVPQGVYACAGHEQWVALSVHTDAQWSALVDVLGRPAWARATELGDRDGRRAAHDAIDAELGCWFADRDRDASVALLLDAGVPAAPVWDQMIQDELPQLVARGFNQAVQHPLAGTVLHPGIGMRSHDLELAYRGPAPMVGQHTAEVLCGRLGLDDRDLRALATDGVIGGT